MADVFNDTPIAEDDANLASKTTANTGIISGGLLTINTDPTKFDISAGSGYIIDHSVSPPLVTIVEWSAFTAQTVTNLATSFATDIAIDSAGAIVQQNSFTNTELRSVILLGGLDHANQTSIGNTFEIQVPSTAIGSSLKELSKAIGDINISGNVFSANGANLKINKSSGTAFKFGANNVSSPTDPHITTQALLTQANFSYVYDDGAGDGVFQAQTSDIVPTSIDNGSGTLASVSGNNFTIQRILLFPNANTVFIQYGTQSFTTLASAISGLSTQSFTALNGIKTAIVRGFLIVRANATALNNSSQALFVNADRFGGIGARDGGGGVVTWGNILGTLSNQTDLQTELNNKQDTLVSATNIKTINGDSVLGSGNLVVTGSGASWGSITGTLSSQTDLQTALDGKVNDTGNETIAGDKTFSGKLIMSGDILTIKDYTTTDSYLSFEDATNSEIGGIYYESVGSYLQLYAISNELNLYSTTEIVLSSPSINISTASKTTPLDADTVYIKDTASGDEVRQTTWSNVKAFLKTYFDTLYQASGSALTMSQVYPIGSIYTSVVSTNPATLLGVGTWVAFGTGRTLVGIDAGQTEFDTVEETGGAKTHTLLEAEIPSHTHTITDPGHAHTQTTSATDGASGRADASSGGTVYNNVANINSNTTGITIDNTGGGGAHNNLQPYIVVYMWKRTA